MGKTIGGDRRTRGRDDLARLTLEILDLPDGSIQVKCSSDVDIDNTPLTLAIATMSNIIAALQGEDEDECEPVVARRH